MRLNPVKHAAFALPQAIAVLLVATAALDARAAGESVCPPSRLWKVVQGCIHPKTANEAAACLRVDTARRYAILKDFRGPTQFLLVATDPRCGIEDPRIEAKDAPNYFALAWSARRCVARAAGASVPDGELSLAINSIAGRSDGQLHIHIDRLRPGVSSALGRDKSEVILVGHRYRLRHIDSLAQTNLFAALAETASGAMSDQTIVVAGDPEGGFFVLDDHIHHGDYASGEELQVDHPPLPPEQLLSEPLAGCADPARP